MGYQGQPPPRHRALEALATRQHGVVSTAQLAELGYSRSSAAKAARSGRLARLHRGVYSVGHRRLTWKSHCSAAILACAPAVASHGTAAWLWELGDYRPGTFDLTVAGKRRQRREFRVHSARLGPRDIGAVDGIAVTSVARTLLDLAPGVSAAHLSRLLRAADEREVLDVRAIEELLARSKGHRGHGPLTKALRIYQPDLAVTRSELERRFRALLRRSGLPMPAANYIVGPYEIDAYWESERFGVELDVYATHGSRDSFERDRERTDDLLAMGVEITRVTDVRLEREPRQVIERVAGHLERRRAIGDPHRAA